MSYIWVGNDRTYGGAFSDNFREDLRGLPEFTNEPHQAFAFATGCADIAGGLANPVLGEDLETQVWCAYVRLNGQVMLSKLVNGAWDSVERELITLFEPIVSVSLSFDNTGAPMVGFERVNGTHGVWFRNPLNGYAPELKELGADGENVIIDLEDKRFFFYQTSAVNLFFRDKTDGFVYYRRSDDGFLQIFPTPIQIAGVTLSQVGMTENLAYQIAYQVAGGGACVTI